MMLVYCRMKKGQKLNRKATKLVAVRIPVSILERVDAVASAQHTGKSSIIIRCVEAHLAKLEAAQEWCALQGSNLRPLPCEGKNKADYRLKVAVVKPIHGDHEAALHPTGNVPLLRAHFRASGGIAAAA